MRQFGIVILCCCLVAGTLPAQEAPALDEKTERIVTATATVFHGIGMGASTGLCAGWVRYADRHEMQQVWESVGYGALGGVALGTGAALAGAAGEDALNDIDRGSALGGGIGFAWGVVAALFTGESPRIADGMAWGNLAGITAGMCYAGIRSLRHGYPREEEAPKKNYSVSVMRDSAANLCPALRVQAEF
jgi:hypothetical protein